MDNDGQLVDIGCTEVNLVNRPLSFLPGCRSKFHKEHVSGSGQGVAPCKVSFDPTSAKEMLLMAASLEDQQQWVTRLLKRIQKSGFKVGCRG